MRPLAVLLLLATLAACSNAPAHDSAALEGYLPPGEVNGTPNKLFGSPNGIPTNFRIDTPW